MIQCLTAYIVVSKEESEKVGSKLNIQKTKIMGSGPITSRQIDGETVETAADFIFLDSKITADGDCSHEIRRRLFLVGCSLWVAKSQTRLSNFTLTFHFYALDKEMAICSSVLAWRIPRTGEPGGLPSMGLHRVGHD